MTDAQTILEMTEEVDPADTAGLDEIDEVIHHWRTQTKGKPPIVSVIGFPQYTRSRDVLKAIRPRGWWFNVHKYSDDLIWGCASGRDIQMHADDWMLLGGGETEELAELHAIIQAIEYERTNPE